LVEEQGGEGGDAAAGEAGAEFFKRAGDAFAGGVFGEVQGGGDGGEGLVFEVTAGEDFAVEGREFEEGGVEMGEQDLVSGRHDGGFLEGGRTAFVEGAAALGALPCLDGVGGDGEEPSDEAGVERGAVSGAFSSEKKKDGLGDVGGGIGVAGLAQRGGVDKVEVGRCEGRGSGSGHLRGLRVHYVRREENRTRNARGQRVAVAAVLEGVVERVGRKRRTQLRPAALAT
jgi:hypothetical protein